MTLATPHSSVLEENFEKGKKEKEKREVVAAAGLRERRPGCSCPAWGRGQRGRGSCRRRAPGAFSCARRARSGPRKRSDSRRQAGGEQGAVAKELIPPSRSGMMIRAPRLLAAAELCCLGEIKLLRHAPQVPPPPAPSARLGGAGRALLRHRSGLALASPVQTPRRVIPFGRSCPS